MFVEVGEDVVELLAVRVVRDPHSPRLVLTCFGAPEVSKGPAPGRRWQKPLTGKRGCHFIGFAGSTRLSSFGNVAFQYGRVPPEFLATLFDLHLALLKPQFRLAANSGDRGVVEVKDVDVGLDAVDDRLYRRRRRLNTMSARTMLVSKKSWRISPMKGSQL
jgi:hypothetical protein